MNFLSLKRCFSVKGVLWRQDFLRRALAAVGALSLAAVFFGAAEPAAAAGRLQFESGGVSRSAVVVLRDRLKLRRRPLVIVLYRGFGLRARRHLGLEEFASSKPVFVYPDAVNGAWPTAPGPDADRDLKFLRELVEKFISEGTADPRRIFLVGVSTGGVFAYRAACAGVGRPLAGLATFSAALPEDLAACAPASPLAFVAVSNALDPNLPFAGGKATFRSGANLDVMSAEATLATFAKIDGCGARRDDKAFPEKEARANSKSVRGAVLSYAGCKAPAELIRVDAATHAIPGRRPERQGEAASDERSDFDASRAVWEFLRRNGA